MPKTEGGVQYKGVNISTINNSTIMPGSSTLNPELSNYYTNNVPTSIRNARGNTKTTSVMTEAEGLVQTDGIAETGSENIFYQINKEMYEMNKQIFETSRAQVETILSEEINTTTTPSAVYTQSGGVSIPAGCKRFMALGIGGGGGGGGGGGNAYIHVNSVGAANAEGGGGGSGGSGGYLYAIFPTMEWYNSVTYQVGGGGGGGGAGQQGTSQTSLWLANYANGNEGSHGESGGPTSVTYGGITYPSSKVQCGGFGGNGGNGGGGGGVIYNGGNQSSNSINHSNGNSGNSGNSGGFEYMNEYPSLSPYGNGAPGGNGANAGSAGNGGAIQFIWIYDNSDDN
jgi:hypothetical protein